MKKIIYIELLNEGTISYRPVLSYCVHKNIYILGEKDDDTEEWAFNPGDYVITEQHVFNDGTIYPLVVDKLSCPEKRITKKNK
jgi:hypothetical protein